MSAPGYEQYPYDPYDPYAAAYPAQYDGAQYQKPDPATRIRGILLIVITMVFVAVLVVYIYILVGQDTKKAAIEDHNRQLDIKEQQAKMDEVKLQLNKFSRLGPEDSYCSLGGACVAMANSASDTCKAEFLRMAKIAENPSSVHKTDDQKYLNQGLFNDSCAILHHACPVDASQYRVINDVALEECLIRCEAGCMGATYIDKTNSCYLWSQVPTSTLNVPGSSARCYVRKN